MKPSIVLRLIVSLVVIGAFVLGATVAEASNSLNPTALWWAQRQLPLLWTVDGFALLALLPVFGSAILQTRLAQKSEELTHLRAQHETQVEDTMQHAEELERRITQQAKSIAALEEKSQNMDVLEATVEALTARLAAMETDNRAHQENMEAEMRRMAVDAFSTLAGEVQANTRQMEAVSLAMQYQRAEIKQLRQNLRATQRPQEINEVARLTPHELSALQAEAPPLLLEEKEKRRKGEEEAEGNKAEHGMMNDEQDSDSSLITPHSSLPLPPTNPHTTSKTGFFEQTMNAQTTFVSPVTEYEIASPTFEAAAEADISEEISRSPNREIPVQAQAVVQNTQRHFAERSDELSDNKVHEAQNSEDAFVVSADTAPLPAVVTEEEYRFLHGSENGAMPLKGDSEPPAEMKQTTSEQAEQISSAPQPAESQPGGAATGGDAAWTAPLVHAGLNLMETPPDTPNITSAPLESALYELVTALQAPAEPVQTASETFCACVVCRLSARSVERWLRTFLAEYVNDPAAREQLRRAQGFCVAHTNVLSHLGDALAIAILYADLSRLTRERWQRQTPLQASASFWKRLRSDNRSPHLPDAPCPACLQQQEADARYVRALAAGLDHPTAQATVWNALEVNPGLCVPHTEQIVQASTPPAAARLLQMEDARLTELQGELEEIIRKNDYRFRGEAWGEEKTAWKRALDKLRRSESGE